MELDARDLKECVKCFGICSFCFEEKEPSYFKNLLLFSYHINFPTINSFKKHGNFEHIKLPIAYGQKVPDDLIEHIFPLSHYSNKTIEQIKSSEMANRIIKCELNKLPTYFKYDNFPDLEDFKDGGVFSHIKLSKNEYESIDNKILNYIFGKKLDDKQITNVDKFIICDRLCFYGNLIGKKYGFKKTIIPCSCSMC